MVVGGEGTVRVETLEYAVGEGRGLIRLDPGWYLDISFWDFRWSSCWCSNGGVGGGHYLHGSNIKGKVKT